MRTREAFEVLIAELEGDMNDFIRVSELNKRAWKRIENGAEDILDWGALSFTIHNLYSCIENYFLRSSKFFENSLPSDSWHKALIDRMAVDIPGLRPAIIPDKKTKSVILNLLRFRHRFRNLYAEELDPEKVEAVQRSVEEVIDFFPVLHRAFISKVDEIKALV